MRRIAAPMLALLLAAPASGQTIDQNQPFHNAHMASFSQTGLAQSFQQNAGTLAGAGIFLQPGLGTTGLVNFGVWTALPNQAGAALIASGAGMGTAGQWLDVFWSAVAVTPGVTYYLTFDSNSDLAVGGSTANPYALGNTYANAGYGGFSSYDYTFRTYSDGPLQNPTVPEPMTVVLLGTGLAGVMVARRRRSRQTAA